MSDCDQPKGEDRKLTMEIHKFLRKINNLDMRNEEPVHAIINIGHRLSGTRVNGRERLITLFDVRKDLIEWNADIKHYILSLRRGLEISNIILLKLKIFKTCPKCKGKKIEDHGPDLGWEDCRKCHGFGLVLKKE